MTLEEKIKAIEDDSECIAIRVFTKDTLREWLKNCEENGYVYNEADIEKMVALGNSCFTCMYNNCLVAEEEAFYASAEDAGINLYPRYQKIKRHA